MKIHFSPYKQWISNRAIGDRTQCEQAEEAPSSTRTHPHYDEEKPPDLHHDAVNWTHNIRHSALKKQYRKQYRFYFPSRQNTHSTSILVVSLQSTLLYCHYIMYILQYIILNYNSSRTVQASYV